MRCFDARQFADVSAIAWSSSCRRERASCADAQHLVLGVRALLVRVLKALVLRLLSALRSDHAGLA